MFGIRSNSVRLTGRWCTAVSSAAVTTAPGSYFELSFLGQSCLLYFDMMYSNHPFPHLWISVDNGAMIEVPLERYIRINATEASSGHYVKVIYKGGMEMHHRWFSPLDGKISFIGFDADGAGTLAPDHRKTIEFVGDSITEGVLIDAEFAPDKDCVQKNRPYHDDVVASYAYILANKFNMIPLFNAYGAVGATKGGCGGVPKAALAYPYCFDGAPTEYASPDYIVLNHGTNDRRTNAEEFKKEYRELLALIRKINASSVIITVPPFCGALKNEIKECVSLHNDEYNDNIIYIDASGVIPAEPIHPVRKSHSAVADYLYDNLKDIIK